MFVVVVVSVFGVVNINDILYFFLVYYVVVVVGGLFRCWFFMDGIVIGCDLCFILLNCWCWMVDGVLSLVWCYCCVYGVKVGQYFIWWGVWVILDCREGILMCCSLQVGSLLFC